MKRYCVDCGVLSRTPEDLIKGILDLDPSEDVISICIPTCERSDFLKNAIDSCTMQNYRPLEIIIGDDSETSNHALLAQQQTPGVTLRYVHNQDRLGQAANVNQLIALATGSRLIVLHDDDLLCPDAIRMLDEAWRRFEGVRCVYGMQQVIDENGSHLAQLTEAWNARYARRADRAGLQADALACAYLMQMPNDGFLVDTGLARTVGYRSEALVGQSVDADFSIRLAEAAGRDAFALISAYTSQYRVHANSISKDPNLNRREDLLFEIVRNMRPSREAERIAQREFLSRTSAGAALDAALAGRARLSLEVVFSRHFSRRPYDPWGLFRIFAALSPRFARKLMQFRRNMKR